MINLAKNDYVNEFTNMYFISLRFFLFFERYGILVEESDIY